MTKSRNRQYGNLRLSSLVVALFVLGCLSSSNLLAQDKYLQDPVNPKVRSMGVTAKQCVGNAGAYRNQRQRVLQYFSEYYFPHMTDPSPAGLGKLGKYSTDLFRVYIWPSQSQAMQEDLSKLVTAFAKKTLVNTNYHPAVRLNAVLMLGKLDAEYAIEGKSNRRPPKPLPEATKLLLQVVKLTKKDPRITPAMMSAALVGLERHARFHQSLPPEHIADLEKTLSALVLLKKPLVEMDQDVHFWLQRQAASGLASLGDAGAGGKVINQIVGLASNEKMSLDERCMVAAMLASISTEGVKIDGKAVVEPVVLLALEVATTAKKEAEEAKKMTRGRGRSNSEEGEDPSRQKLLARLVDLDTALGAIRLIAGDKYENSIVDVKTAIGLVRAKAKDTKKYGSVAIQVAVRGMASSLEDVVSSFDVEPMAEEATG